MGHTNLITMDINIRDFPYCKKPYTLPLKHIQWVHDELEMLEKLESFHEVFPPGLVLLL